MTARARRSSRVVIIGAGRIGCGYLAPLFRTAGYQVSLGCRTEETAKRVADEGGWLVRETGEPGRLDSVSGVVPVWGPDLDDALAEADLVVTSVGVGNVGQLGDPLATGLAKRGGARVDIWSVENDACAGRLRTSIERAAHAREVELPAFGVAGAVASVVVGRGSWHGDGRPEFVGDAHRGLVVDEVPLTSDLPPLPGVTGSRHYRARLHEKIYGFNAGHALTAYLGWLRGHQTLDSAVGDPFVRPVVAGALLEARRATLHAYPMLTRSATVDTQRDVHRPVGVILARFADAELADPITRVAREPIRKLGPRDRLLGPVRLLSRVGGSPRLPAHFALGVAAALLYGFADDRVTAVDPQTKRLRALIAEHGVLDALGLVSGLRPTGTFTRAVADRYYRFAFLDDGVRFPPACPDDLGVDQ
ncbi:hypothetical protein [Actinokineospora sp.]|uniref:mannitol dehydrogenase family protein n=1 Tax=Actinokineospora sp. TaxID=1872133 RepID=UPI003D6A493E